MVMRKEGNREKRRQGGIIRRVTRTRIARIRMVVAKASQSTQEPVNDVVGTLKTKSAGKQALERCW